MSGSNPNLYGRSLCSISFDQSQLVCGTVCCHKTAAVVGRAPPAGHQVELLATTAPESIGDTNLSREKSNTLRGSLGVRYIPQVTRRGDVCLTVVVMNRLRWMLKTKYEAIGSKQGWRRSSERTALGTERVNGGRRLLINQLVRVIRAHAPPKDGTTQTIRTILYIQHRPDHHILRFSIMRYL